MLVSLFALLLTSSAAAAPGVGVAAGPFVTDLSVRTAPTRSLDMVYGATWYDPLAARQPDARLGYALRLGSPRPATSLVGAHVGMHLATDRDQLLGGFVQLQFDPLVPVLFFGSTVVASADGTLDPVGVVFAPLLAVAGAVGSVEATVGPSFRFSDRLQLEVGNRFSVASVQLRMDGGEFRPEHLLNPTAQVTVWPGSRTDRER